MVSGEGDRESEESSRAWQWQKPPVLVPVPVMECPDSLLGKCLTIFSALNHSWTRGMIAVSEVRRMDTWRKTSPDSPAEAVKDVDMVEVLFEPDYYRRERERAEQGESAVTSFYMAAKHLWVDTPVEYVGDWEVPDQSDLLPDNVSYALVEDASRPPARYPIPATCMDRLTGERIALAQPHGLVYGRAIGEPRRYTNTAKVNFSGGIEEINKPVVEARVPICSEPEYFRWQQTGYFPQELYHVEILLLHVI